MLHLLELRRRTATLVRLLVALSAPAEREVFVNVGALQ